MYKKTKVVNKSDLTIMQTSMFGIHCSCVKENYVEMFFESLELLRFLRSRIDICNEH